MASMFFGVIGVIKYELCRSALLAAFHPMNIVEILAERNIINNLSTDNN